MNGAMYVPSKFSLHCFSSQIDSQQYKFDVIKMNESLLIFVNLKQGQQFDDLAYVCIDANADFVTSIQIFSNNFMNDASRTIVSHLGKKLNKNIYLSLNVSGDRTLYAKIEGHLFEEIRNNPDKF